MNTMTDRQLCNLISFIMQAPLNDYTLEHLDSFLNSNEITVSEDVKEHIEDCYFANRRELSILEMEKKNKERTSDSRIPSCPRYGSIEWKRMQKSIEEIVKNHKEK